MRAEPHPAPDGSGLVLDLVMVDSRLRSLEVRRIGGPVHGRLHLAQSGGARVRASPVLRWGEPLRLALGQGTDGRPATLVLKAVRTTP